MTLIVNEIMTKSFKYIKLINLNFNSILIYIKSNQIPIKYDSVKILIQ